MSIEERQERLNIGNTGEKVAANFLLARGYKIIEANYFNEKGYRWGEIDLIVKNKQEDIIFVEVKTRKNFKTADNSGILPEENITSQKIRKIEKAAILFLKENDWMDKNWRIDAVTVIFNYVTRKVAIKQIKYIRV